MRKPIVCHDGFVVSPVFRNRCPPARALVLVYGTRICIIRTADGGLRSGLVVPASEWEFVITRFNKMNSSLLKFTVLPCVGAPRLGKKLHRPPCLEGASLLKPLFVGRLSPTRSLPIGSSQALPPHPTGAACRSPTKTSSYRYLLTAAAYGAWTSRTPSTPSIETPGHPAVCGATLVYLLHPLHYWVKVAIATGVNATTP